MSSLEPARRHYLCRSSIRRLLESSCAPIGSARTRSGAIWRSSSGEPNVRRQGAPRNDTRRVPVHPELTRERRRPTCLHPRPASPTAPRRNSSLNRRRARRADPFSPFGTSYPPSGDVHQIGSSPYFGIASIPRSYRVTVFRAMPNCSANSRCLRGASANLRAVIRRPRPLPDSLPARELAEPGIAAASGFPIVLKRPLRNS